MPRQVAYRLGLRVASLAARARFQTPSKAGIEAKPDPHLVVSLTSFPARIDTAWWSVESLLRQNHKPDAIVLALAEPDFPGRALPERLQQQQARGLTILWVERDIRSFEKLLPALAAHPRSVIVTADDDVLYPARWLEGLWAAHQAAPQAIVGHRGTEILLDKDGRPRPYIEWPAATPQTPSARIFLKGDGGVLYPPGSLPDVTSDLDLALKLCPTADDVWFKAMELLAGTQVRRIASGPVDFPVTRGPQAVSLRATNVGEAKNDPQFEAVMDHFDLWDRLIGS